MLDFVLNLLIFFIVTSAYVKVSGVQVSVPMPRASEEAGGNIFWRLQRKAMCGFTEREVDIHAVRAIVARMHAENPDGAVVIQSDSAQYRHVSSGDGSGAVRQASKIAVAANPVKQ